MTIWILLNEMKNKARKPNKGQKPTLNKNYIKHSIIVLIELSALSTKLVLQNIYSKNVSRMRITLMT